MTGKKYYFGMLEGQILYAFVHTKDVIYEWSQIKKILASRAKLKAFVGHIRPTGRMLCMSDIDGFFPTSQKHISKTEEGPKRAIFLLEINLF